MPKTRAEITLEWSAKMNALNRDIDAKRKAADDDLRRRTTESLLGRNIWEEFNRALAASRGRRDAAVGAAEATLASERARCASKRDADLEAHSRLYRRELQDADREHQEGREDAKREHRRALAEIERKHPMLRDQLDPRREQERKHQEKLEDLDFQHRRSDNNARDKMQRSIQDSDREYDAAVRAAVASEGDSIRAAEDTLVRDEKDAKTVLMSKLASAFPEVVPEYNARRAELASENVRRRTEVDDWLAAELAAIS